MNINQSRIEAACNSLSNKLDLVAKDLGYNIQVMYSKTDLNNNNNNESMIYVVAEYYRPLFENRINKSELRKVVPKIYVHDGLTSRVKLEYVKLPITVRKKLSEIRKYRNQ
jgi:hypothetical protein